MAENQNSSTVNNEGAPTSIPKNEIDFARSIASFLSNLEDENLKKRAKLDIQRITLEYSNRAIEKQIQNGD